MHPADIKASLAKAGLTQSGLAAQVRKSGKEVSRTAICRVVQGTLQSARIAAAISTATAIPVAQLFPGRYPRLEFMAAKKITPETRANLLAELTQRMGAKGVASASTTTQGVRA